MKRFILLFVLATLTVSAIASSAPVADKGTVYRFAVYKTGTKQLVKDDMDVSLNIEFNGSVIRIDNKQRSTFFTTLSTYTNRRDANNNDISSWQSVDEENIRCKVLMVRFYETGNKAVIIEYTDYTFVYYYH